MLNYAGGTAASPSSVDGAGQDQMNTFYWLRKAIIEARKDQYFTQLADVTKMP